MNVQPFFGSFPVIDLGDIVLRDIRVEDAGAYLDYMSNDQMAGFLTKENRPQSFDAAVEKVSYWGGYFLQRGVYIGRLLLKRNMK